MTTLLFLSLLLASGAAPVLLTPVSYETALLSKTDGAAVASVLACRVSAVDSDSLSLKQKGAWKDLSTRIRVEYPPASRRQRAQLTASVLELQGLGRSDHSVWFRLSAGDLIHAQRVNYTRQGSIWRLVDRTSGQYLAIVEWSDSTELTAMFGQLLRQDQPSEASLESSRRAAQQGEARTEAMVEVNGQRQYLSRGTVSRETLAAELAALLPNLADEGGSRILQGLALLESLRTGATESGGEFTSKGILLSCALPCDPAGLPLPPVPRLKLRATARRTAFLEPPDEAAVEEFFGDRGWANPDLEGSFESQVRKLLSGAR